MNMRVVRVVCVRPVGMMRVVRMWLMIMRVVLVVCALRRPRARKTVRSIFATVVVGRIAVVALFDTRRVRMRLVIVRPMRGVRMMLQKKRSGMYSV